jgi:hypothetical protein
LDSTVATSSVLGAPASLMGRALRLQGFGPSLCPVPMPQGVCYVQISGLLEYIRNLMSIGIGLPCQRSWAVWTEAILLLRAALATLFDELVAPEVAVDHQVLIS